MMARRTALLSATVALVCGAGVPAVAQTADGGAITITSVDTSAAPTVKLTVAVEGALASQPLDPEAFTVLASGEEQDVDLVGLPSDPIALELVVDTSGSMRGAPIDSAKAAAAQLVANLPDSVEVGVIGFGSEPYTVIDPTSDHAAVGAAIGTIQVGGETAMYDAVVAATQRFTSDRRVVVVLTDGADTASATSLDVAAASLRDAGSVVYVVALDTPETDLAAAQQLADATGGRLELAADPNSLTAVYAAIAQQLSALYEISYEARRTGSTGIVVRVSADGTTAEAETRVSVPVAAVDDAAAGTPQTGDGTRARPAEIAPATGLLERDWVFPIAALSFFIAIFLTGLIGFSRSPTPNQLRVAREIRRAGRSSAVKTLTEQATDFAERSLDKSGRRRGLERALEDAGINMRAAEVLVLAITSAFAAFAVGFIAGGPLLALVLAAGVVSGARLALAIRTDKRRGKFAEQLEQTLPLMAGGLRAGFGIMQALDSVAEDSEQPPADEFRRVILETRLGRDLSDALDAMADRVGSDDFRWVVQAIDIHRQVGGDLAEVLDRVYETIRDRNRIRRHISALSGEGRLSAAILFALPIGLFAYLATVNPDYISELTSGGAGLVLLVGSGVLMVLGGLWMRRIIRLVF